MGFISCFRASKKGYKSLKLSHCGQPVAVFDANACFWCTDILLCGLGKDTAMSDRRAELERKKARLQALREEKDRRRREKELKDVEEATNRVLLGTEGDRKEVDELLTSLGVAPVSEVLTSISSASSLTPEHSHNHTPDTSLLPNSSPNRSV